MNSENIVIEKNSNMCKNTVNSEINHENKIDKIIDASTPSKDEVNHKIQPKKQHRNYRPDIVYIDANSVDHTSMMIKNKQVNDTRFYDIMYRYGQSSLDRTIDESFGYMSILIKNLKLCQKRYGAITFGNMNYFLPLDNQTDEYRDLEDMIKGIRNVIITHIVDQNIPFLDKEHAEELRNKKVSLEMVHKGRMCKIMKLGTKSEEHINVRIKTVDEFNSLLKDYRYNKINSDSFYRADVVVSFRCSVYKRNNKKFIMDKDGIEQLNPKTDPYNMVISFTPYLKLVVMRYNKARCVPVINTENKVVPLDNVLVL